MKGIFSQIIDFAEYLKEQSSGLDFEINTDDLKSKILKDPKALKSRIDRVKERIKREVNYEPSEDITLLYYLNDIVIKWDRPGQNPGENVLHGGTSFNGLTDVLTMKSDFWSISVDNFGKDLSSNELSFLNKLSWFESPTPHASAIYTPMYGCFELEDGKSPKRLFFYDSGTKYKLDMTIETYISNMIDSAAVNCWQYFYINPEEIIKKNKGVNGSFWGLYMESHFSKEADRMSNIVKHLENCLKYLPEAFPEKDFSFHKERLSILKSKL